MATPLSTRRRLAELLMALVVIWIAQAFGIVAESLKLVAFDAGQQPAPRPSRRPDCRPNAIALAYQFGYLILPAVVPAGLWIGLNREFIDVTWIRCRHAGTSVARARGPSGTLDASARPDSRAAARIWNNRHAGTQLVAGFMAAVAPTEHAAVRPASEASLDERICQFLVARGRLKDADLVRGTAPARGGPGFGQPGRRC